jgi:hypothetical protein
MRAALFLMTLSLVLLWAWLGRYPALHADAMTLAEVWRGLQQGAGLGHWLFSTACSLFPDLGAMALASCWTQDLPQWQRWHGFFIGMGVAWGASRLMRQQWALSPWQARAFVGAGLCLGLAVCRPLGFGDLFSPGHHGWACVMALWAWAWALRQEERPSSWAYSLCLALPWGLTWASDGLFMVWALLPILFLGLQQSSWPRNRIIGCILLAAVLRWTALMGLRATGAKVGVFLWPYASAHAAELWLNFVHGLPAFLRDQALFLAVSVVAALLWAWLAWRNEGERRLLAAWALSLGASVGLCMLVGVSARYLLFPFWCLVLFAPLFLALAWPAWSPLSLLVPALLGLLWLAPGHAPALEPLELRQAAWLDAAMAQRGLSEGWSDYFRSRPLRLFSQRGLQVLPMISQAPDRVDPYLWVVDRRLFPEGQILSRPQFVVINGLDPGAVEARLGPPREKLQGEDLEVWVYGRSSTTMEHR